MAKIGGKKYDIEYIVGTDDQTKAGLQSAEKGMERFAKNSDGLLTSMRKNWLLLGGAIGGLTGAISFAKGALETASSFEQMAIQLDVLTKGRGVETLDRINRWALEMPVNTQEAVQSFVQMTAFGLNPTIKSMEILTDVASVFGQDALPRVSRALGQMKALGKLSAEELNQLSEVGINAREILFNAFGQTVEEIQKSGRNIDEVINALWKGMDEKFGGAAKKAMTSWEGLTAVTKSYLTEISKAVMTDSGAFQMLKNILGDINTELEQQATNINNNMDLLQGLVSGIGSYYTYLKAQSEVLRSAAMGILPDEMELRVLRKRLKEIKQENETMFFELREKRAEIFENTIVDSSIKTLEEEYEKIKQSFLAEKEMYTVNGKELESLIPSLGAINKDISDASEKAYKEMYGRLKVKTKDWAAAEIAELQKLRDWWALFDEDLANQLFAEGRKDILQEFIDSRFQAVDKKEKANTMGMQLGEALGNGIGQGLENSASDALYTIITNQDMGNALEQAGQFAARMFSDAFMESLFAATGIKSGLTSLFTNLFTGFATAGGSAYTGSIVSTGGTGSVGDIGSYVTPSKVATESNRITINNYIYEDAMLEKKVNNVVSKAIRNNSAISKQMRNN
ncbi:MAG: tape measure protein [Candidatus Kuenenia sp.]|nr:tape measure protein [Candidatus Kuenenia hertensis]